VGMGVGDTGTGVCVGGVVKGSGAGSTGMGVEEGVIARVIVAAITVGDATFSVSHQIWSVVVWPQEHSRLGRYDLLPFLDQSDQNQL